MNKNDRRIIVAIVVGILISIIIHIGLWVNGHPFGMVDILKTTGAFLFITISIAVLIQFTIEYILEFINARSKWRLVLILILFVHIFKAIAGYILSQ